MANSSNSSNSGNSERWDSVNTGNIKQIVKTTQSLAKTAEKQLTQTGTMDKLVKSGAVSLGSSMAKEFSQNYFGSMAGEETGTIASSALSTAITGAGIVGTLVPGPWGIAAGAIGGLILGGISGISQVREKENAAFKAYVQEQFNQTTQGQTNSLLQGSALAAQRETETAPEGAETYLVLTEKLLAAQNDLDAAMGAGYNTLRKEGLAEQEAWLNGDSGAAMQEAYGMIGQWKASLENTKEQLEREALDAVMTGTLSNTFAESSQGERLAEMAEAYQEALASYEAGNEEAGAKMGALLAEAQVIAMNEYNASDGALLALEAEKSLADAIRKDTAGNSDYWSAGYEKGQWFTKGLASAIESSTYSVTASMNKDTGLVSYTDQYGNPVESMLVDPAGMSGWTGASKRAVGIDYVPYDNFPALLHQGERVQTAVEARSERSRPSVQIIMNGTTIREDADIDRVASAFLEKMELAGQRG